MDLMQKDLDEIVEEFKQAAIPAAHCHYCKQPVFRLPFQEAPGMDGTIMCLTCMGYYMEYKKLND